MPRGRRSIFSPPPPPPATRNDYVPSAERNNGPLNFTLPYLTPSFLSPSPSPAVRIPRRSSPRPPRPSCRRPYSPYQPSTSASVLRAVTDNSLLPMGIPSFSPAPPPEPASADITYANAETWKSTPLSHRSPAFTEFSRPLCLPVSSSSFERPILCPCSSVIPLPRVAAVAMEISVTHRRPRGILAENLSWRISPEPLLIGCLSERGF